MAQPKVVDPFYTSPAWQALRKQALIRDQYRCTIPTCQAPVHKKGASRVDHIKPRKDYPELALVLSNVRTLCATCDNRRHAEKGGANPYRGSTRDGQPLDPAHPWNGDPFQVLDDAGRGTGQHLGADTGVEGGGQSSPYPMRNASDL